MAKNLDSAKRNIGYLFCFMIVALLVLLGRIAWLQFVQGSMLAEKARNQVYDEKTLQSPRGTIFDRNGRELAVSFQAKSLYVDPKMFNGDPDTVAALLAPLLQEPAEEIREKLTENNHFVWLKRTLDPDEAINVQLLIKQYSLEGLRFEEESKRYYPNDMMAAQVLGFVGTDDEGLNGLEMTLNDEIKGGQVKRLIATDNYGKPIFSAVYDAVAPKQGKNVYLTIDSNVQLLAEQAADQAMATTAARGAAVIVMDPRTGEILGMASRPTYNPNQFYQYKENEMKNRAISVVYEPGSTFKSVVAAAALQEGLVSPDEHFHDVGFVEVSGRRIQNWDGGALGDITFTDILKNSINTGFVQVGLRLGANKLIDYAKAFGFGTRTGIDLPGEEAGILFDPQQMRDSDIATMSIGQSVAVTPLQLITAVAAIANDGVLLKPHIIKEFDNADGSQAKTIGTEQRRQVITQETAHKLQLLMEKVITEGGGVKGKVTGYRFAGKTGTAQRLRDDGTGYEDGRYIASFIGYGPLPASQVVALVVIDSPQGVYYGGQVAAPIFADMMTRIMRCLNIAPDGQPQPLMPSGTLNSSAQQPAAVKPQYVPAGKAVVPDIRGKSLRGAGEALAAAGLAFVPTGSGYAVGQSIVPYTIVDAGTEVTVDFAP